MTKETDQKVAEQSDDIWSHTPKLEPVWATGAGCSCSLGQRAALMSARVAQIVEGACDRERFGTTRRGTKKPTSSGDSESRNLTTNFKMQCIESTTTSDELAQCMELVTGTSRAKK